MEKKQEFVIALAIVIIASVMLALPYAVTEAYGFEAKKLILLLRLVVLAVFSGAMLIFWIVRYRQTSHDLEMLREEIEQNRRTLEKPRTPRMTEVNQKERDK